MNYPKKKIDLLHDKKIILGVSGGIAAYKAVQVVRSLKKKGAEVDVIMTSAAQEFVTPLTFKTISQRPVATGLFSACSEDVHHISLAQKADLIICCPATANLIGKVSGGIADDLLTTTIMATKSPVLFVPAMNDNMYANQIFQENVQRLKTRGYYFMDAEEGFLACGTCGKGRLPEPEKIVSAASSFFRKTDFEKFKITVTAGATREYIDPVRFISNPSSGRMGYKLAEASRDRGAEVVLISGASDIQPPDNIKFHQVNNTQKMRENLLKYFPDSDIIIMAAAVSDYRPAETSNNKIKKSDESLNLQLERTTDILSELGQKKGNKILVGFAAETENLIENAREKLKKKNLDLIVANKVNQKGVGFGTATNQVTIISRTGELEETELLDKREVAEIIMSHILKLIKKS